jgi:hypothetical protein
MRKQPLGDAMRALVVCLIVSVGVSGCFFRRDNVYTAGVREIFREQEFEQLDLPQLLDPDDKRAGEIVRLRPPRNLNSEQGQGFLERQELALALQAFYDYQPPQYFIRYAEGTSEPVAADAEDANAQDAQPVLPESQLQAWRTQFGNEFEIVWVPVASNMPVQPIDQQIAIQRETYLSLRRNRIQDRIIAASNQRCHAFAVNLMRNSSMTNFALGSVATGLAGAGAIFTPSSTVRGLSGAASILSGVRAEYNQDFLQNQTVDVILAGIEVRRRRLRHEMEVRRGSPTFSSDAGQLNYSHVPFEPASETRQQSQNGEASSGQGSNGPDCGIYFSDPFSYESYQSPFCERNLGLVGAPGDVPNGNGDTQAARGSVVRRGISHINAYSIEMAIADSIRYHASCTLAAGLEEAEQAIQMADNPGIGEINDYLESMERTQQLMQRIVSGGGSGGNSPPPLEE